MTQKKIKIKAKKLQKILPLENGDNSDVKIVDINENTPHKVSEVICVKCGYRWLAVRPVTTLLKDLECPQCSKQGFVIETGEVIN